MSKADDDAQKWIEMNARSQRYELYKAKETGTPYYINQHGDVIHDTNIKPNKHTQGS